MKRHITGSNSTTEPLPTIFPGSCSNVLLSNSFLPAMDCGVSGEIWFRQSVMFIIVSTTNVRSTHEHAPNQCYWYAQSCGAFAASFSCLRACSMRAPIFFLSSSVRPGDAEEYPSSSPTTLSAYHTSAQICIELTYWDLGIERECPRSWQVR